MGVVGPFGLKLGGDVSFSDGDVDFLLSLDVPLRRGGLFGRGDFFRVDYFPTRYYSFNFGLTCRSASAGWATPARSETCRCRQPMAQARRTSRSRAGRGLQQVDHAAEWIHSLTTPFFDQTATATSPQMRAFRERVALFEAHLRSRDALYPDGHSFQAEIRVYHRELERAFALAAGAIRGRTPEPGSGQARGALLDEVILPYNRLLGQRKTRDSLHAFRARAADASPQCSMPR